MPKGASLFVKRHRMSQMNLPDDEMDQLAERVAERLSRTPKDLAILREKDRHGRTGISRSQWDRYESEGLVPMPVRLGSGAKGWLAHERDAWIMDRAKNHRLAGKLYTVHQRGAA